MNGSKIILAGGVIAAGLIWSKVAMDYVGMAEETASLKQQLVAIKPCPVCPPAPERVEVQAVVVLPQNISKYLNEI